MQCLRADVQVASGFNPATIIGILCVFRYRYPRFEHRDLLRLLEKYIAVEKQTIRRDEALENELRVLQMMVERAKHPPPIRPTRLSPMFVPTTTSSSRDTTLAPTPWSEGVQVDGAGGLGEGWGLGVGDMPDDANPWLWAQCLNQLVPQLEETAGFLPLPGFGGVRRGLVWG